MVLPKEIQFSQGSLQDYIDCPRRFQLRYVKRLRWPAIETKPVLENERHLRHGADLHRLIRQHVMGIPVPTLSRSVTDPQLRRWWRNYLEGGPEDLPSERYPEVMLSTQVGGHRLVARYDLVARDPKGNVLIVDWKTSRKRPRRAWLSERLQTHVYPYVLVRAAEALGDGRAVQPDRVSMVYWFAGFPSIPERFAYDAGRYRGDERYLVDLVEEIAGTVADCPNGDLLPATADEGRCRLCRYRSLCRRGVEAGWLDEREQETTSGDPFDFTLDFEQIAELDMA